MRIMTNSTDYSQGFDVSSYLFEGFSSPGGVCKTDDVHDEIEHTIHGFAVKNLHDFFLKKALSSSTSDFRVLDFGCGPVIANVISAARVATEVVLAEYTEEGRSAVQMWLEEDPNAFNWSPYFKYVVQTLEGGTVEATEEREKRLRSIMKGVVHCDITQATPIEIDYQGPYNVVISCFCILNACKTADDFLKAVGKLATLVKPKGHLLLSFVEPKEKIGANNYKIGNKTYGALAVDRAFTQLALRNYFNEITVEFLPMANFENMLGTTFFVARKQ